MFDHGTAKADHASAPASRHSGFWSLLLQQIVGRFARGTLTVDLPSATRFVLTGDRPGRNAHIAIHRWRDVGRIAIRGDIGFAESLADGMCTSADLKTLLLWAIENTDTDNSIGDGLGAARILARLRHGLRANSRSNSRRNIAAHYDLGNAFYAGWLDAGMSYSSGIYASREVSLAEAQQAKLERAGALLDARRDERVLEIGCGWGALAEYLVRCAQCRVTGITLSQRQLTYAQARLADYRDHADLRLQDYRDVEGRFDHIVSIEMLEAVGEAYWPTYFAKLKSLLAAGGTVVLQVITIDESRYEIYRSRPDFIQLSIFPGGMLPTKAIIAEQAKCAGLNLCHSEHFGASYARTLADWRTNFVAAWPQIAEFGFDERFKRLWEYYLVYCEAGFEAGWLNVGLYKLRHTEAQPA